MQRRRSVTSLRPNCVISVRCFTYPDNADIVEDNTVESFLDRCGHSEEFRLVVKRTRPKTLQQAMNNAIQEECLMLGERHLARENKHMNRVVLSMEIKDARKKIVTHNYLQKCKL